MRVIKDCKKLTGNFVEAPSLETFKTRWILALSNLPGTEVGLDDHRRAFLVFHFSGNAFRLVRIPLGN